jgi:hypothetical protein
VVLHLGGVVLDLIGLARHVRRVDHGQGDALHGVQVAVGHGEEGIGPVVPVHADVHPAAQGVPAAEGEIFLEGHARRHAGMSQHALVAGGEGDG